MFVTVFYAVLDAAACTLTYANAGHNPPYRIKTDGTLQTLEKGGLLLGMMPDMPYEEEVIELLISRVINCWKGSRLSVLSAFPAEVEPLAGASRSLYREFVLVTVFMAGSSLAAAWRFVCKRSVNLTRPSLYP